MRRLSAEDEKGLRFLSMSHYVSFPGPRLRDVLAEIDALRAMLSTAEQRGRELELADVIAWMRRDENYELTVGRSWGELERGKHKEP